MYGSAFRIFTRLSAALDEDAVLSSYLLLLSNKSENILETIFTEKTTDAMLKAYPYVTEDRLLYPVTFVSAGIVCCYLKWSASDKKVTTMEGLIKELSLMIDLIIKNLAEAK